MEDKLKKLCSLIHYETIHKEHLYENDIIEVYESVLQELVNSYNVYRAGFATVLGCFEQHYDIALAYSIHKYLALFEVCVKFPIATKLDHSITEAKITDKALKTYESILVHNFVKGGSYSLSQSSIDVGQIPIDDLKELASLIVDKLQNYSKKITWDNEDIQSTILDLTIFREICVKLNAIPLFYQMLNSLFDRLYTSELHQIARDLSEEVLITAFIDKVPVYGFFICMKSYSNQGNVHASLLYANLTLTCISLEGEIINDKFLFEIIWQSMKLFRNNGLQDLALQMHSLMPQNISLSEYEKHSIDHSYYSILLMRKERNLPYMLAEYLNKERESILSEDEVGCMPWMVLLYNIRRLKDLFDFDSSGLSYYLTIFEGVVPPWMVARYKYLIEGNVIELKRQIKESLLKLLNTRNKSDYVYDNEMTVKIASRLIETGIAEKDEEAVLLAALVRADFSILFENKESSGEMPLVDIDVDISKFYDFYINPAKAIADLNLTSNQVLVCLLAPEDKIFQLTFNDDRKYFNRLDFDINKYKKWVRECVPKYSLKTELPKNRYGISSTKFVEDFEAESIDIVNEISSPVIKYPREVSEILLIKDMELSELPHNLLLNEDKEFVSLKCPISNVVSIEWLNSRVNKSVNTDSNGISLWIPTESGDGTINMLFGKLESIIDTYNIASFQTTQISTPLSSSINIISSHGSSDISRLQVIHPSGDEVVYNLDKIIGDGKVLIMLVCYSGSATKSFFKNEVLSIVRKYLTQGYEAVIAPFWALHVDIPPIWLPVFINELQSGAAISTAVFKANLEVYKTYPTPTAWACMHLYGNALFKLK